MSCGGLGCNTRFLPQLCLLQKWSCPVQNYDNFAESSKTEAPVFNYVSLFCGCKMSYLGSYQVWTIILNTEVTKVLLLPLVPKGGGVPRDPSVEKHFSTGILQWNLHRMCMDYKNSQFWKNFLKCCTVSKWRPKNRFLFRVISILAKIWKTTFPKEFFKEIWLKVGEH